MAPAQLRARTKFGIILLGFVLTAYLHRQFGSASSSFREVAHGAATSFQAESFHESFQDPELDAKLLALQRRLDTQLKVNVLKPETPEEKLTGHWGQYPFPHPY
jgi:hypothetical protein